MSSATRFFISATALTNCLRGVVFQKQKKIPPPLHPEIKELLDLFRTFADVGQQIQTKLRAFWQEKGVLEHAEDWIPRNDVGFTGKFDAICTIQKKPILYEIKGASKTFFSWVSEHKEARPEHRLQVMVYHKLLSQQFPNLEPRLLYVSRNHYTREQTLKGVEIPITYEEDEFENLITRANSVREALEGGALPSAAPAIDVAWPETKRDVSMKALTCRHHALCLDNANWYVDAKKELGEDVPPAPDEQPPEVPF